MKKQQSLFFKVFVRIYVIVLFIHSCALDWSLWQTSAAVLAGVLVAILAHSRYGIATIALLVFHMGIEWFEHSKNAWRYTAADFAFHGIHVCLDFVFLYQELRMHAPKYRHLAFTGIGSSLVFLFWFCHQGAYAIPVTLGRDTLAVEPFIMGGMFGCIGYHVRKS